MFRLKRQQEAPVLPLSVRRLWTVGASGSIALSSYILVGYCINQVAGASTLVSVIISSVMAAITGGRAPRGDSTPTRAPTEGTELLWPTGSRLYRR